jgi:hypothetical protein
MSNIQPYSGTGIAPAAKAPPRQLTRALSRLSQSTDLAIATVNAQADIEAAQLDGLQMLAGRAMQGVAMVSQLEQQLSDMVPLAHSRLQAIGDMHAMASADVLAKAARRHG